MVDQSKIEQIEDEAELSKMVSKQYLIVVVFKLKF